MDMSEIRAWKKYLAAVSREERISKGFEAALAKTNGDVMGRVRIINQYADREEAAMEKSDVACRLWLQIVNNKL